MEALEQQLQRLTPKYHVRHADALHDMLISLGDLTGAEIAARTSADAAHAIELLVKARRAVGVRVAGEPRYIAVEDVARYRDALGVPVPRGVPEALLSPVQD